MSFSRIQKVIALPLCVALVAAGLPRGSVRAAPDENAAHADHLLRDAIPAVSVAAPPDSTEDEFFLPEEQDNKKLIRDITAWLIACAFVAFFIIKVFIEEDDEPAETDSNGKPIPSPF